MSCQLQPSKLFWHQHWCLCKNNPIRTLPTKMSASPKHIICRFIKCTAREQLQWLSQDIIHQKLLLPLTCLRVDQSCAFSEGSEQHVCWLRCKEGIGTCPGSPRWSQSLECRQLKFPTCLDLAYQREKKILTFHVAEGVERVFAVVWTIAGVSDTTERERFDG